MFDDDKEILSPLRSAVKFHPLIVSSFSWNHHHCTDGGRGHIFLDSWCLTTKHYGSASLRSEISSLDLFVESLHFPTPSTRAMIPRRDQGMKFHLHFSHPKVQWWWFHEKRQSRDEISLVGVADIHREETTIKGWNFTWYARLSGNTEMWRRKNSRDRYVWMEAEWKIAKKLTIDASFSSGRRLVVADVSGQGCQISD